jgi:hypothetical protein
MMKKKGGAGGGDAKYAGPNFGNAAITASPAKG